MKNILAVMIGLCCLVAFSSISMATSKKTIKKENKVVQEKQTSVKGEVVNRGDEENAKNKKISQINLGRRNMLQSEAPKRWWRLFIEVKTRIAL